jgi:hypothetical protein
MMLGLPLTTAKSPIRPPELAGPIHLHFRLLRRASAIGASGLWLACVAPTKPVRINGKRKMGQNLDRKGLFFTAASSFHFILKRLC